MPKKQTIKGLILDANTKKGISNLSIEAWEQDVKVHDLVGKEVTDASGRFAFSFDESYWKDNAKDKHPIVFFRVYDATGNLLRDTQHQIYWTEEQKENPIAIAIGEASKFVYGKVLLETEKPASHLVVRVYQKSLKLDRIIAASTTDNNGDYSISYPSEGIDNIIVRVFNPKGKTPIASSSIVFGTREKEEVNLTVTAEVYQSLSLYETIEQSIAAVLGELEVNALDADQIKLLANESGIEQKELLVYQNAQVLSKGHHLSAEVFFVILHNGMETSEEKLFSLSEEQLKHLLAKSWDEHLISTARSAEILKEISVHEKLSIHYQLLYTSFSSKTTLLETWSSLKLNKTQLAVIGTAMKTVGGNSIDFWNTIKKDKTLKPLIPKLELLTGLNNVTLGNLTLIKKISQNKAVHSLADLAGWSHDKWVQTIGTATIPEEISGKPNQRIHTYATSMKRMVDYLYPTRNVIESYVSDKANQPILKADYSRFYQNNPNFLIETHNLENYLKKHPKALVGLKDKEAFTKDMEITTRLFRLSPAVDCYENMMLLKKLNITNSKGITQKGYAQFQSEYTALGGQSDSAQLIYRNAQHYSAMVNTLIMGFMFDQNTQTYAYNNNIKQDATWRTLFGSVDYCGCQHCKSVYSPAAYLTDSLHFLENRKQTNDVSFYQVLDARRPDIKHILLNCENANTPMPYVDLVNEVLEAAVVQENMSEFDFSGHQTTRTMEELMASPQHLEEAAYASLKDAIYPWFMPFDLYNRLGKTYLEHLGVKHHKLVSMFPFSEDTLPARPSTDELNTFRKKRNIKARLGLNETDWEIILGVNYMNQEAALWGANTRISSLVSVTLEKTQLSLEDLKILVNTKFVNPNGKLIINFPDLCSVEGATLKNYNGSIRKRMLQMVRLQRKLNTDIRTVDHILNALQAPEINVNVLSGIAQLVLWQEMYNLPLTELVSWVGNLPTANINDRENHRELYEQTFLSYLEGHSDTTRDLFALSEDRKKLRNETYTFNGGSGTAIRNYISGALNISSADLNTIISILPTNKLTLANLSIIYGILSLARTLRISVSETIGLHKITTSTTGERMDQFLAVSDAFTQLQKSKFTVTQVLYLFGESQDRKIAGTRKIEILQEIREGLWKLDNQGMEENGSAPLTPEAFIFEKLGSAFGIDRNVISLLLTLPENSDSDLVPAEQNVLKSYLNFFLNSADFLSQQDVASDDEESILQKLEELCELLNKISLLYEKLEFNTGHYQLLLTEEGKGKWIDLNHLGNSSALRHSFFELLKLNEIVNETSNSPVNLFDLMSLPLNSSEWLTNAADLLNYQDTGSFSDLIHVLGINNEETQEASVYLRLLNTIALEKHLGIHIADYTNANSQFQWAKSELDQSRVMEIIQVAKSKYGEDKWQNVTKQLRDSIREEQRDALMTFLMATKKDSFGNPLDTPEKLYAHFLLDTEMSACTVTSRIRLALSSVQLFVQRCLMNLESHASLQGIDDNEREEWKEWTWRKNYRVWEANRKVFLYPENWLEPEWRDDKTPFFKELESELQQNELTTENAESAYLNYLYKLESVSNLEILAMCEAEKVDDVLSGYYIFGRTHGTPKTLYFRKYLLEPESFTPWKKVEVDFEGDHLMPLVHENRLYVYWPKYNQKNKDESGSSVSSRKESVPYWSLQLAWSMFKNKIWTPSKISDTSLDEISSFENWLPSFTLRPFEERKQHHFFEIQKNSNSKLSINFCIPFDEVISDSMGVFRVRIQRFLFDLDTEKIDASDANGYVDFRDELLDIHNQMPDEGLVNLSNQRVDHTKRSYLATNGGIRVFDKSVNQKVKMIPCFGSNLIQTPIILQNESKQSSFILSGGFKLINFFHISLPTIIKQHGKRNLTAFFDADYNLPEGSESLFENQFSIKTTIWEAPFPTGAIEFDLTQAYSQYNWELFFHIPMHIANKLRQDQKFEEAQKWFHYVFNPTSTEAIDAPKKFWVFQPFRDYVCNSEDGTPCNIQELMRMLNEESETLGFQEFEQTVHAWERNPFSPHTVARTRIIAYMKWVVMRYIDNLIEWADQLFRRDSIESLNEATQLYMLAWNILGDDPHSLNEKKREDQSYNQLREKLDEFSNALVKLEDRISQQQTRSNRLSHISDISIISPQITIDDYKILKPKVPRVINQGQDEILPSNTLYFCIPQNEKLLGYWDLVRDRFFKLRHCLNIEGVYRQLPLYEPPIDPALLIKAKNSGLSIADALSAEYAPKSHYRFLVLLQKAIDYANDVRSFGASLLSALEKRDAEQMVALRSIHEVQLLNEVTLVRKEQINELKLSNDALDFSMENIEHRRDYYANKEYLSSKEREQQNLQSMINILQIISQSTSLAASLAHAIPTFEAGYSGWGGHFTTKQGGYTIASVLEMSAQAFSLSASIKNMEANQVGQNASYERRSEDWKFQESTAEIEIKQLEKQILAAQIRMSIAKQELRNHELQVENSTKQLELVQAKFTNFELYDWMVGQLKTLYFQSYQMAFDMAKKAERALAFEHGIGADSTEAFIKFGYWDNLKEGLLSGEKLHHDLKRMEMIYMQRNKRLHEVSKTVSLAMIDAEELTRLRATGTCRISIPELLLDLDFPQHTNRKIKSVSITIPAVTGPYTGINAILSNIYGSIACSGSQNDAGMFQFNFNDERYLPFEGQRFEPTETSELPRVNFNLEMNSEFRAFDYNTITDVLMHLHYTAEEITGGEVLTAKKNDIKTKLSDIPFTKLISIKNEFSQEWFEAKSQNATEISIDLSKISLPYVAKNNAKNITTKYALVELDGKIKLRDDGDIDLTDFTTEVIVEMASQLSDIIVVMTYEL